MEMCRCHARRRGMGGFTFVLTWSLVVGPPNRQNRTDVGNYELVQNALDVSASLRRVVEASGMTVAQTS